MTLFSSTIAMVSQLSSLRREPAASTLLPIPVPLLQRLTFGRRPKSKQKVSAPAIRPDFVGFPRSIIAPGARREGPSLAHRGSRGIHAAQPLTQRFHSAS